MFRLPSLDTVCTLVGFVWAGLDSLVWILLRTENVRAGCWHVGWVWLGYIATGDMNESG
jgi:hypothetical protein